MAMEIEFDVVDGFGVREKLDSLEIVRPILVKNVPGDCSGGQNPGVLLQALTAPGMPSLRSGYPYPGYTGALLEERNPRSIRSVDSVAVDLVYRLRVTQASGINTWSLTDSTQTAHLITYVSADGSTSLLVWYEPTATDSQNVPPASSTTVQTVQRIVGVQKINTYRVLKAASTMRGDDWATVKDSIHDAAGKINSDTWGSHGRGTWLFLGPSTKTFDPTQSVVQVELNFLQDKNGHFPLLAYVNEKGVHPANSITEKKLRDRSPAGPPVVGAIKTGRGLTLASIYQETAFSGLFSFTP